MIDNILKNKTIAFLTLGCKVNSYETDAIRDGFEKAGCLIVEFGQPADICVINTCSVTNIADRKSRQMLHKARVANPNTLMVATGCYAQIGGEQLIESGDADIVIGNNHKSKITQIVAEAMQDKMSLNSINVDDIALEPEYEDLFISDCADRSRAFIKIQDGCNQFCSYCIIPFARGRVRSRSIESIMQEVNDLASKGYKEVVLTGIHLSSYGIKDYEKQKAQAISNFDYKPLLEVINSVATVDGIKRIRLGSLEPRIISDEFMEALSNNIKFCPQFHLSLQSGCDETLKRMNRHYTTDDFYSRCGIIRKYFYKPAITTDIITGFPGETDDEFDTTLKFLAKVNFAQMHVFKFSRRKGTVADKMSGQLTEAIKHERSERVIDLDSTMHTAYMESFIGDIVEVLVEREVEIYGGKYLSGLTDRYINVAITGFDQAKSDEYVNKIVKVIIIGMLDDIHLTAKIV